MNKFELKDSKGNETFFSVVWPEQTKNFRTAPEKILSTDATINDFRSIWRVVDWFVTKITEICFYFNRSDQVGVEMFSTYSFKRLKKAISCIKSNPKENLKYVKPKKTSLILKVYANSPL